MSTTVRFCVASHTINHKEFAAICTSRLILIYLLFPGVLELDVYTYASVSSSSKTLFETKSKLRKIAWSDALSGHVERIDMDVCM